jgi:hypothetical protein
MKNVGSNFDLQMSKIIIDPKDIEVEMKYH